MIEIKFSANKLELIFPSTFDDFLDLSLKLNSNIIYKFNLNKEILQKSKNKIIIDFSGFFHHLPKNLKFDLVHTNVVIASSNFSGNIIGGKYFLTELGEPYYISSKHKRPYLPLGSYSSVRLELLKAATLALFKAAELESIQISLNGGALLGLVRDNNLIPFDDDIDFALVVENSKSLVSAMYSFKSYLFRLTNHGFMLNFITNGQCHITHPLYPRVVLDVFIGWFQGGLFSLNWAFVNKLDYSNILPFQKVDFIGMHNISVFSSKFDIVELIYGKNWNIPNENWQVSHTDSESLKFALLNRHSLFTNGCLNSPLISHNSKYLLDFYKINKSDTLNIKFIDKNYLNYELIEEQIDWIFPLEYLYCIDFIYALNSIISKISTMSFNFDCKLTNDQIFSRISVLSEIADENDFSLCDFSFNKNDTEIVFVSKKNCAN